MTIMLAALAFTTTLTAIQTIKAGKSAAFAAKMDAYNAETEALNLKTDAFNVETDVIRGKAEAIQRSNDRLEAYRVNLSSNIAQLAAQGRDIGGADRSVSAFLERQKEIAAGDVNRSDFMAEGEAARGMAQAGSLRSQASAMNYEAGAIRREGRARQSAATISAFTTIGQGIYNYSKVR